MMKFIKNPKKFHPKNNNNNLYTSRTTRDKTRGQKSQQQHEKRHFYDREGYADRGQKVLKANLHSRSIVLLPKNVGVSLTLTYVIDTKS